MASSASALNSVVVACLLALIAVAAAAGAARTEPDAKAEMVRLLCHSHNGWSDHLCRDVCQASGFSGYDFALANADTGNLARCCCCPKGKICVHVDE